MGKLRQAGSRLTPMHGMGNQYQLQQILYGISVQMVMSLQAHSGDIGCQALSYVRR